MWIKEGKSVHCGLPTGLVSVRITKKHKGMFFHTGMVKAHAAMIAARTVDISYENRARMALLVFRKDNDGDRVVDHHPSGGIKISCAKTLNRYGAEAGYYRAILDQHTGAVRVNFDVPIADPMSLWRVGR